METQYILSPNGTEGDIADIIVLEQTYDQARISEFFL